MPADYRQRAPAASPGEPQAPAVQAGPSAPTRASQPTAPASPVRDSQLFDEGPEADAITALEVEDPAEVTDVQAAAETEDHEAAVQHDLDQLTAKAEKADEYLQLAQRTRADFDNYRKRAARGGDRPGAWRGEARP